jgi:hypothetical protein
MLVDLGHTAQRTRSRRLIEGIAFIAVWMTLGYLLPVNELAYLLMGIPLTIAFQTLVRRRPLRELWVADASKFALDRRGMVLAAVLVIAPAYYGSRVLAGGDWTLIGWYGAAVIGAGCAAFALRATSILAMLRSAAVPMAVGVGGMVIVLGGAHVVTGAALALPAMLGTVAKFIALYFPMLFLIEEVAFRGALDAHVHHAGEGRGWQSALLVSAVWGLWHLPISTGTSLPVAIVSVLAVHCLIGIPLSLAWRRSRNLAGVAFAHAAIDAVRNAFMLGL